MSEHRGPDYFFSLLIGLKKEGRDEAYRAQIEHFMVRYAQEKGVPLEEARRRFDVHESAERLKGTWQ